MRTLEILNDRVETLEQISQDKNIDLAKRNEALKVLTEIENVVHKLRHKVEQAI